MLDVIRLTQTGISTGAADTNSHDKMVSGAILHVFADVSGTTPDFDLNVIATASARSMMPEIDILQVQNVTADTIWFPRGGAISTASPGVAITDSFVKIHFFNQVLKIETLNATGASQNVTVYILIDRD